MSMCVCDWRERFEQSISYQYKQISATIIAYQNTSYEFHISATLPSTLIEWYAHEYNIC